MPLTKNEQEGHCLSPFENPSWLDGSHPHSLCLVATLIFYLAAVSQAAPARLFVCLASLASCPKQHIAQIVCHVNVVADQGHAPASRDLRQVGVSLNYLGHFSEEHMGRAGQWSTVPPFPFVIITYLIIFATYHVVRWGLFPPPPLLSFP